MDCNCSAAAAAVDLQKLAVLAKKTAECKVF